MGYSTDFTGEFKFNKKLDKKTLTLLAKLNATRRMKRNLPAKYGVDGEFYVNGKGFMGQDDDKSVIDSNMPPSTQPSLWCQWVPTDDGKYLAWDGGEKFYCYVEWLEYLIEKIIKPKGYSVTGTVEWVGEYHSDFGKIVVKNNNITIKQGKVSYE